MLRGYQFDRSKVTAIDDANLFSALSRGGNYVIRERGEGMDVVTEGLNVTAKAGAAIIQGRFVELVGSETLVMPINTRRDLVITIDLTQTNDSVEVDGNYESINNQLKIELVEDIIQDDLNNGGLIYMLPLATVRSTTNVTDCEKRPETYREFRAGSTLDFNTTLETGTYVSEAGRMPALLSVENDSEKIIQTYSKPTSDGGLHEMRRMNVGDGWSNWFDLYEPRTHQGVWTPVLLRSQGIGDFQPFPQVTYTNDNRGHWQRIGDRVFFTGRLSFTMVRDVTTESNDALAVGGLPFGVTNPGFQANREMIDIHTAPRLTIPHINNALQTRIHGMTIRNTSHFQLYTNNVRLDRIRGTANSEGVLAGELTSGYLPIGATSTHSLYFSGSYLMSE